MKKKTEAEKTIEMLALFAVGFAMFFSGVMVGYLFFQIAQFAY